MLEIYIATLKARIAGGPCQHGEGRRVERGFSFSMPALCLRKWQPQPAPGVAYFLLLSSWSLVVVFWDLNMMLSTEPVVHHHRSIHAGFWTIHVLSASFFLL